MAIGQFRPMFGDEDRCELCHAPQVDHHNGACNEECDECGMVGSSQFMAPVDHDKDCSRAQVAR